MVYLKIIGRAIAATVTESLNTIARSELFGDEPQMQSEIPAVAIAASAASAAMKLCRANPSPDAA